MLIGQAGPMRSKGLKAGQKCVKLIDLSHWYQISTLMTPSARLAAEALASRLTSLIRAFCCKSMVFIACTYFQSLTKF